MDSTDLELLMKLQYEFPLSSTPFEELGEATGISEDEVIRRVMEYLERGVVARLGLHVNYRSLDESKAALVALKVEEEAVAEVARVINATKGVKHNYLRDCEEFNVWFTVKARTLEELSGRVTPITELPGVEDWVILPTRRVYKLDVKYDIRRGVSWSDPVVEPEHVPTVRELGLDLRLLADLERGFRPARRPFEPIAERHGLPEEGLFALINELTRLGVARGFGAVLSSEKLGFAENAMVALKAAPGEVAAVCERLVRGFPQITHCVERVASPKWNYPAYVMIHARERAEILDVVEAIRGIPGVSEARPIFSLANLRGSR